VILSLIVLLNLSIIAVAFGEIFLLKENTFMSFSSNKSSTFLLLNSEPASNEIVVTLTSFKKSLNACKTVSADLSLRGITQAKRVFISIIVKRIPYPSLSLLN